MPTHDDDAADLDPREYPEPDAADTGEGTVPCPSCRKAIYEDVDACPYCGHFFSDADRYAGRPWWFVVGAIVALALAVMWVLGG